MKRRISKIKDGIDTTLLLMTRNQSENPGAAEDAGSASPQVASPDPEVTRRVHQLKTFVPSAPQQSPGMLVTSAFVMEVQQELVKNIQSARIDAAEVAEQIAEVASRRDDAIEAQVHQLKKSVQKKDAEVYEAMANIKEQFSQALQELRAEFMSTLTSRMEESSKEVTRRFDDLQCMLESSDARHFKASEAQRVEIKAVQIDLERQLAKHDDVFFEVQKEIQVIRDSSQIEDGFLSRRVDQLYADRVVDLQAHADLEKHFHDLETTTLLLQDSVAAADSTAVNVVEWPIAIAKLDSKPGRSSRSRMFPAAGYKGFQMELRHLEDDSSGDCQLCVTGGDGLKGHFRLFVGKTSEELHHTFLDGVPCSMKRCRMQDEVVDGILRVGFEILEGPCPLHGGRDNQDIWGDLLTTRLVMPSFNQLIGRMQGDWQALRSRMIGKVEWRLEQVMLMQQSFGAGKGLYSPMFSAGGEENLQLVFYPSGDGEARSGYCSAFLYQPGRSNLQCWLTVGRQRREALPVLSRPGFFGRPNFGIFSNIVDKTTDTITIVLEISEAQRIETVGIRNPSTGEADGTPSASRDAFAELLENSSRLQGHGGRVVVEDTILLPCIWSPPSTPLSPISPSPCFGAQKTDLPPADISSARGPKKLKGPVSDSEEEPKVTPRLRSPDRRRGPRLVELAAPKGTGKCAAEAAAQNPRKPQGEPRPQSQQQKRNVVLKCAPEVQEMPAIG